MAAAARIAGFDRMKPFLKIIASLAIPVALMAWLGAAHAQTTNATVFPCPVTTITTGGTAVIAIPSSVNGAIIANFPDATENLFVDQTKASTTTESATNYPIQPGQPWYVIPKSVGPAGSSNPGVSVNAVSSVHSFFCIMW